MFKAIKNVIIYKCLLPFIWAVKRLYGFLKNLLKKTNTPLFKKKKKTPVYHPPFLSRNTLELLKNAKDRIDALDKTHPLVHGPLVKNDETYQLEMIGRKLIEDIGSVKAHFYKDDKTVLLEVENNLLLLSFLNSPSNETVPVRTLRKEDIYSEAIHQQRVEGQSRGVVLKNAQFLSSSFGEIVLFDDLNTEIFFTHLRGKYINLMSDSPAEQEFLIPPCQIRWLGYQFNSERNKHCFLAQIVDTPEAEEDALSQPTQVCV